MKLARILVIMTILMVSAFAVSAQEDACYNKGGIWDAECGDSAGRVERSGGYERDWRIIEKSGRGRYHSTYELAI